ncbi:hypothetical protein AADX40_15465 [Aeromonas veronii]|uniref:hypothetical protein n=1 Tax=Aeromonas TaxID=642 RepID=UPI0031589064
MTTNTQPTEGFELPERSLKKLRNDDIHEALQRMTKEGVSLRKIRAFVADNAAVKISAERLGAYLKATFDYESPRSKALAEKNRGG